MRGVGLVLWKDGKKNECVHKVEMMIEGRKKGSSIK